MQPLVVGGIAVAALLIGAGRRTRASVSPGNSGSGGLSARRLQVPDILAEVVPSEYPDARFHRLDPTFDPATTPGTTCGALPGYVGLRLGDPGGITHWGVEGVRIEGKKAGAWVPATGRNRPKLGDFFGTCETPGGILVHVGVIVDASESTWRTADAGQGTREHQQAAYVNRLYDPASNTFQRTDYAAPPRYLAGWYDLDLAPIGTRARLRALRGSLPFRYPRPSIDSAECR